MYPESDPEAYESSGSATLVILYLYPSLQKHYCHLTLAFSVYLKRVSISSFGLFLFHFYVLTTEYDANRVRLVFIPILRSTDSDESSTCNSLPREVSSCPLAKYKACMEAFRLLQYFKIRSCSQVLKTVWGFGA
jgi:hypothetical protein